MELQRQEALRTQRELLDYTNRLHTGLPLADTAHDEQHRDSLSEHVFGKPQSYDMLLNATLMRMVDHDLMQRVEQDQPLVDPQLGTTPPEQLGIGLKPTPEQFIAFGSDGKHVPAHKSLEELSVEVQAEQRRRVQASFYAVTNSMLKQLAEAEKQTGPSISLCSIEGPRGTDASKKIKLNDETTLEDVMCGCLEQFLDDSFAAKKRQRPRCDESDLEQPLVMPFRKFIEAGGMMFEVEPDFVPPRTFVPGAMDPHEYRRRKSLARRAIDAVKRYFGALIFD
jgi:hypothetical protein